MGAKFDFYYVVFLRKICLILYGNKSVALESMVRKIHVKNSILQY